jgi:pimeloyl-ACP methyl ester carboxylesterase
MATTSRNRMAQLWAAAIVLGAAPLAMAELPRRGMLGVMLAPVTDQNKDQYGLEKAQGAALQNVMPDTAAAKAGLKPNDVIIAVGDQEVQDLQSFQRILRKYYAGDTVKLTVLRDKTEKVMVDLVPIARPKETSTDYDVIHDFATTKDGRVRTIITKPKEGGKQPAIIIVQGVAPMTVDFGIFQQHPLKPMVDQLTKAGLVTMRVERLGMGDSEGTDPMATRLPQDVSTFSEALKKLRTYDFVDADNVFILAHSSGGALAPLIAQGEKVKGIITYAAFARPFTDHVIEASKKQWELELMKEDEVKANVEKMSRFIKACYVDRQTPSDVFGKYPDLKEFMAKSMQQGGGNAIDGLHYEVWQQLAALDLPKEWAKVDANVLAIWGEADFASCKSDSEVIAKAVNATHAGKGAFETMPGIDHMWNHAEDQEESFMAGFGGKYNPALGERIQGWVKEKAASKSS